MKKIDEKSLFEMKFLSDVKLSPDGGHMAFVAAEGDIEINGYRFYIWLYDFAARSLKKLTGGGAERSFVWLDNNTILFPAARGESDKKKMADGLPMTVYQKISIGGGEAEHAFTVHSKVNYIVLLSDTKYLTVCSYQNGGPNYSEMDEAERESALRAEREEDGICKEFDEIPFWTNGLGVTNKKRNRAYLFDSETREMKAVTPPLMNVDGIAVSDDKTWIALAGPTYEDKLLQQSNLYRFDLREEILEEIKLERDYHILRVAVMGGDILMEATPSEDYNCSDNYGLYLVDLETGKVKALYDGDFSIGNAVGSDCKFLGGSVGKVVEDSFSYISTRGYSSHLYSLGRDGVEMMLSPEVQGCVDCFDMDDKRAVYVAVRDQGLQEVYSLDLQTGKEEKLTAQNDDWLRDHNVLPVEHFVFSNREGTGLDGFIIFPADYREGKSYPGILNIHGGPKMAYGDILYHEMQLWANEGYFVFFCNPRGSDGRGSEFANISGDRFLEIDYNDFMDFTDEVLLRYPDIDERRIGVTGGSYGGLMVNWMIGHTDRYRSAVSQRSIANIVVKCLTSDFGYYHNMSQMGRTPWEDPKFFWERSPIAYADKVKTPTLFIHSDEDYKCYMADGIQMFTALKYFGVPSKLCLFHGENHNLSRTGKPKSRIKRLEEITGWFNKYM